MDKNAALICIDLQRGLKKVMKHLRPYSFDAIVEQNKKMIDIFTNNHCHVYLVCVQPRFFPKFINKKFGALVFENEANKHENIHILIKYGPSVFRKSNCRLEKELKELKVKKIYITGVTTSNGVLKTAQDGCNSGFEYQLLKMLVVIDKKKSIYKH